MSNTTLSFDELKDYSNQFTEIIGHSINNNNGNTYTNFYFANENDKNVKRPIIDRSMTHNKNSSANPNAMYIMADNLSIINSKSHITISRDHWNRSLLIHATVYFVSFDSDNKPMYNDGGCYYIINLDTMKITSIPMIPEIKRSYGKNGRLSPDCNVPSSKIRACVDSNLDKNIYPQPIYTDLNMYYDKKAYNGHVSVMSTIGYLLNAFKAFIIGAKKWKEDKLQINNLVQEEQTKAPVPNTKKREHSLSPGKSRKHSKQYKLKPSKSIDQNTD